MKEKNHNNEIDFKLFKKMLKQNEIINQKLDLLETKVEKCLEDYEKNKNADLMIIEKLENIGDFLKNNYNYVIEEKERFYRYPYDD